MKFSSKTFALGLAAAMLSTVGVVSANELVITDSGAKKGGQVALDFMNSGEATALEFEISVPRGVVPNTAKCVSEVPKSHVGACRFDEKSGKVVVMVYSNDNAILPAGIVPIGTIAVDSVAKGGVVAQNLLVAGQSAQKLSANISGDASSIRSTDNLRQNQSK